MDGGVLANNPSLALLNEVLEFNQGLITRAVVKMREVEEASGDQVCLPWKNLIVLTHSDV